MPLLCVQVRLESGTFIERSKHCVLSQAIINTIKEDHNPEIGDDIQRMLICAKDIRSVVGTIY